MKVLNYLKTAYFKRNLAKKRIIFNYLKIHASYFLLCLFVVGRQMRHVTMTTRTTVMMDWPTLLGWNPGLGMQFICKPSHSPRLYREPSATLSTLEHLLKVSWFEII